MEKNFYERVYEIVAKIPRGSIATYGQIAMTLGQPRSARTVGWAMRAAPYHLRLPTHRVVNRLGELAPDHVFGSTDFQKSLLLSEGITFNKDGLINMKKHLWIVG